jgi:hypothetical protein
MPNRHRALSRARGRAAAALLAMLAAATQPAEAQEPASVIIVFDGSGSMGAYLEGTRQAKHILAKDAFRRALPRVGAATRMGIAALGNIG